MDIHRLASVGAFDVGKASLTRPVARGYRLSAMLLRVHHEQGHASLAGTAGVEAPLERLDRARADRRDGRQEESLIAKPLIQDKKRRRVLGKLQETAMTGENTAHRSIYADEGKLDTMSSEGIVN